MNAQLTTDAGFRERSGVNSLVIARPGFPNYGVIFTTSDQPEPGGLDPAHLLGAMIEHVKFREKTEDRYFKILGGYFYQPDGNGGGTVSNVFGIAGEDGKGFDIREGGDSSIGIHWTTLWKTTKFLREGVAISASEPAQAGWTFITEPKYGEKVFPLSTDPVALWIDCPVIKALEVVYGTQTATEQTVSLSVVLDNGYVERISCNWGDGSATENLGQQQEAAHTYAKTPDAQSHEISVQVSGFGDCKANSTVTVSIPAVNCPTVQGLDLQATTKDKTVEVTATVRWEGGTPKDFTFDWGDGNVETLSQPTGTHSYSRPIGNSQSFLVSVKLSGPGSCEAQFSERIQVSGICPVIESVSVQDLSQTDTSQVVKATASMQAGIGAETYVWDWGDGSADTTSEPTATHTYQVAGAAQTYTLEVQANGPGACVSRKYANVSVKGGVACPQITRLFFKQAQPDQGKVLVTAEVQWEGSKDVEIDFDWGDGQQDLNANTAVASHAYPESYGQFKAYDVTVSLRGPQACQTQQQETVRIVATDCGIFDKLAVSTAKLSDTEQTVEASLSITGPSPTQISWDWGEGEPPVSGSSVATHRYPRKDKDQTYIIKAKGSGPGSCSTEITASHTVPAKAKIVVPPPVEPPVPWLCKVLPYAVAFFNALTLGCLVLLITALNTGAENTGVAIWATVISAVLLAIDLFLWYTRCKPTRCDWLAIGWVTFLSSLITIFRATDCVGESPLLPGIIAFVLGAVFGFLWFRSCSAKAKTQVFLIYFAMLALAGIIAGLLITPGTLAC